MGEVTHVVALQNPVASRAEALAWRMDEILYGCDDFAEVIPLQTTPDPAENRAQLYESVPPGSLLVVAGGDGTLSRTVRDMVNDHPGKPDHLPETPVVAFGTGNKNDMARMLNGRHHRHPMHVIRHGQPVGVSALEVTHEHDGVEERDLALYSLGFNTIGRLSRMANDRDFRAGQQERGWLRRHIAEYRIVLDALRESEPETVQLDGQDESLVALFLSNGDLMAGQGRFPASLSEQDFYVGFMRDKRPLQVVRHAVGALTTHFPNGRLTRSFEAHFSKPTIAEIDGEDYDLAPGTVRVKPGPAVTFLSTRLSPVAQLLDAGV